MSRLDDYRTALLAAFPEIPSDELVGALEDAGEGASRFIVDHGLGPLWHARTGRDEFHESRMQAEALFVMQQEALAEIDEILARISVDYVLIKGAANRLLLYNNPAVRACYDLDLLVRPVDRVSAASALAKAGFTPIPELRGISRVLMLSRGSTNIDLHWGLLREGRLRVDPTVAMLDRRRRKDDLWMLRSEDALFVLLVHPAFAKHLGGWDMGVHRVADLLLWIRTQGFDWAHVRALLRANGVSAAAWATLRWTQLLSDPHDTGDLQSMLEDLLPGRPRQKWLEHWLQNDLPSRVSGAHWVRLLGFSAFLHDTAPDAMRALSGRWRARRRSEADLTAFGDLSPQERL